MRDVLMKLKEGKSVEIPIYDFTLHKRVKETKRVYGATVILFEGKISTLLPITKMNITEKELVVIL